MTYQPWLIFTPAQREQVVLESETTDFKISPRIIDGDFIANLGEPLFDVGKFVVNIEVLIGPEYGPVWANTWVGELPVRGADSDVLFLPPVV
jgi:hypothetical protein